MIHYHGTPISGKAIDAARFLVGRHALVSYARQQNLPEVLEWAQSFVLDNGAFSYWKTGEQVPWEEYYRWASDIGRHPACDWVLIPDKIDGTEAENSDLVTRWIRSGCRVLGVPVWHLHESLGWLDYLVSNFQRVALGSSGQWSTPGTSGWWKRMGEAMRVACDASGRPRCKLHGLRMLDPEIFQHLPLASADSANAGVNAGGVKRFGNYPAPTAGTRAIVIAERIESINSASTWECTQAEMLLNGGGQ